MKLKNNFVRAFLLALVFAGAFSGIYLLIYGYEFGGDMQRLGRLALALSGTLGVCLAPVCFRYPPATIITLWWLRWAGVLVILYNLSPTLLIWNYTDTILLETDSSGAVVGSYERRALVYKQPDHAFILIQGPEAFDVKLPLSTSKSNARAVRITMHYHVDPRHPDLFATARGSALGQLPVQSCRVALRNLCPVESVLPLIEADRIYLVSGGITRPEDVTREDYFALLLARELELYGLSITVESIAFE